MSRTLIVYLHGIGDNIMLSGVLKEYCRLRPDEKIDLAVQNAGCTAIWKNNPLVSAATVYPASQPHYWNPVKFYLAHQWTVRRYIGEVNRDGRYQRVLFPTIQTLPEIIYHLTGTYGRHKIDRLCRDLDVPEKLYPYDLHPTPDDALTAAKLLEKFSGTRLAVLHPFSGHTKKRISADGFGKILNELRQHGFTPLVVGAPSEQSQLQPAWQVESFFGLSLGVLIEVLKRANVFAGTDSAVAHLSAFANTPHLVIFSPKLEPSRYLPISARSKISLIRTRQNHEHESLAEFSAALSAS
jgi:ADP-heptose:LPS heptosyltransferase